MKILKIYWFYQIIKNIKSNNIELVKLFVEKHFQDTFNKYFFNLSYSYSYDCFDYFYKRLKVKNGGEYFLSYYRGIDIKKNANIKELARIFQYDFGQKPENNMQDIDIDEEIDRLRYQIINNLLKRNQFDIIQYLVEDLSQRSKNSVFKAYLANYRKFNQLHIEKLIRIFTIEQTFFEKKILDCYHPNLDKQLYSFIKNNYDIDRKYYISCFLRVDNKEVIKQINNDFNVSVNTQIQKIHESLSFNYKYKYGQETFGILDCYQSLGYLNEENILKSFKQKNHEIIIDFTYLPLLRLSKETEKSMLKKNLNIIIFNKEYHYNYKDEDNIKEITTKLDNYFDFIKDKIDLNQDTSFIEELLQPIYNHSEDILIYFYKKFPEVFMKKSFKLFSLYLDDVNNTQRIIELILNEREQYIKDDLIQNFAKALIKLSYYREEHNNSYFLLKNHLHKKDKEILLYNKIQHSPALPLIKDILEIEDYKQPEVVDKLFLESICQVSKNSIYLLEEYALEKECLVNGFMKLINYEYNETNSLLGKKILEKNIQLSTYEQYLVKEYNIDFYKLYQSYSLNKKLEDKYQIKNTKKKVIKI